MENVEKLYRFMECHHLRDYQLVEKLWKNNFILLQTIYIKRVLHSCLLRYIDLFTLNEFVLIEVFIVMKVLALSLSSASKIDAIA